MKCEEIRTLLSPYFDGMTNEEESQAVEAHLASCPLCRKEFEYLKLFCLKMRELGSPQVPDSFLEDLRVRLLEEQEKLSRPRKAGGINRPGWAAAAAAAFILAAGIYASSIMPVGEIVASWWDKANISGNSPAVIVENPADKAPDTDNFPAAPDAGLKNSETGVNVAIGDAVNDSENSGSPADNQDKAGAVEVAVKPDTSSTVPGVEKEVEAKIASECSVKIKVEDAGDSVARAIKIADSRGGETVSISSSTDARIMSDSDTNVRELVLKIDKDRAGELLSELENIGIASNPVYGEITLTGKYYSVQDKIEALKKEISSIESKEDISAADQDKLAEYRSDLQELNNEKAQLEKELNTVTVRVYFIEEAAP